MQSLDEKEWKPIKISDIFETIKPGKISQANQFEKVSSGGVNYVAATNRNNGVLYQLEPSEDLKKKVQAGNCIGFIKDGDGSAGYAIYKHEPFASTVNVIYGYADWLNRENGLFFVAAQDMIEDKYSHGYKRNLQHLRGDKVMLPVDDKDNPDYAYMAEYTRQKRGAMMDKYRKYAEVRVAELGEFVEIPALDEKEWAEFRIGELFKVSRPMARNKDDYRAGGVPFVASGSVSNGVMKLCEPLDDEPLDKGCCITVSPVDGSTFFQPMDFLGRGGAGSSILILRCAGLNMYRGQFMARVIRQTCSKYTYGHMGNKDSIKRERIMLPIDDFGEPDYAYMEQYSKNMMLRKYKQYLEFINRQNVTEVE